MIVGFLFVAMTACSSPNPVEGHSDPVDHQLFDELLKQYVKPSGFVDYAGLKGDRQKLKSYLAMLTANPPNDEQWSEEEQLAYWINLYNAFTLDLVLEHYPLKSIKDIGSSIQIPFVNTPWDIKFIKIGDEEYDLNNIEHGIIRKQFDEPRIHFAVNCASISCPNLRAEAYTGERLEQQLEEQTRAFVNDPTKNRIDEKKLQLSKIFQWYGGDFSDYESIVEFIQPYTAIAISKNAKKTYLDYDWGLNEAR